MNEVSGGKQEMASTSSWDAMINQPVTTSIPPMHHLNPPLTQEANQSVTQVIVPTPVKLQPQILSPPPLAGEHCIPLGHMQQPTLLVQVCY